ncbi:heat shock protein 90 [Sulfurifustis variabilis]|uniref:Chaperone protein HtpG n=1 Tax=Sulfurifustis variabilis TaxID=1675686 RepID=A0A1B4VC68_9GAMM|nr:molecular chaperone HtpG [Sulfurifustis variabilis]BAU48821.1 heat shock protein 90 [Sulfurifustis variabilis]
MSVDTHRETLGFQTEVRQLLDLMIHSLYSNKEIFLRELISNGSDAADKLRFEALTDDALFEGDSDLKIGVRYDRKARTVTVTDNGIGMSRAEVIEHIGTIAKSGTREFLAALSGDRAKDARLIGQFGVGFYSAFIVADRVTLVTRRAGLGPEHGIRWESDGKGEYTVETVERRQRGTEITLHLKEGEDEFLDGHRLRAVVRKYSDHIPIPIVMASESGKGEDEVVNRASALWARPKNEIKPEEYEEFYKHVAHDFEPPLAHVHSRVEGRQEYISLLYVPRHAPFDLWERDRRHGVKLYVRRVFIMDDAEQLLPNYLRFVRGVIDSNDLPLNVSREILQRSRDIDAIRAGSVKKTLDLLTELAERDKEKYATFWKEFGRVLKEGIIEDPGNREAIAKLLRFASTHADNGSEDVSLADYAARMKPGQEKIYYITADSLPAARHSPHLEIFRQKGVEVLLLHDRIDEWLMTHLTEFEKKPLVSVAKGDLDLGGLEDADERKRHEEAAVAHKELVERIKRALGERVKDVRVTHRLTNSPACLVVDQWDVSVNLGRLLKAAGQAYPQGKPILEVNPGHPLVQRLRDERAEDRFADWSTLLFDQASLAEGGSLEDPAGFVRRLNALLLAVSPPSSG